jgi:hypothetical protein
MLWTSTRVAVQKQVGQVPEIADILPTKSQ